MNKPYPAIADLIPQRSPFVMVDEVEYFEPMHTVTRLEIRPDNLFVEDGEFTAAGLVENIAQTCAARMGCVNMENGEAIRIGVIGAVKNLNILRCPKIGEVLHTTMKVQQEVFDMVMAEAYVENDEGERCAEGQIKIALT